MTNGQLLGKQAAAEALALGLMAEHGLTAAGWVFEWDRAKRRAGVCWYPTAIRPGRIGLSLYFVERNSSDEIAYAIKHELAHALAGRGAGHGPVWKSWAVRIGARPVRSYTASEVSMPAARWRAACPSCHLEHDRHRRPPPGQYFCHRCGPVRGSLSWRQT